MSRALSTRRGHRRYEKLGKELAHSVPEPKLLRSTTLPAPRESNLSLSRSAAVVNEEPGAPGGPLPAKLAKKARKSHPLFGLFDGSWRKKAAARPELARYLAYVKEGGVWDANPHPSYG
ncbi:hypothetical protein MLD38_030865 [Melastoma candidum]|nr:hypothetical protein MLD38_030865 [Melastoma candidum]